MRVVLRVGETVTVSMPNSAGRPGGNVVVSNEPGGILVHTADPDATGRVGVLWHKPQGSCYPGRRAAIHSNLDSLLEHYRSEHVSPGTFKAMEDFALTVGAMRASTPAGPEKCELLLGMFVTLVANAEPLLPSHVVAVLADAYSTAAGIRGGVRHAATGHLVG